MVGPTRCSVVRVTLFRLKNQSRYVSLPEPFFPAMSVFIAHYSTLSKTWTFLREFTLGNNKAGPVADANTPALGGEDPRYAVNTLAEGRVIYHDFDVLFPHGDGREVGPVRSGWFALEQLQCLSRKSMERAGEPPGRCHSECFGFCGGLVLCCPFVWLLGG